MYRKIAAEKLRANLQNPKAQPYLGGSPAGVAPFTSWIGTSLKMLRAKNVL
jgi:hypothetical protein